MTGYDGRGAAAPTVVGWIKRLEGARPLDGAVRAVQPLAHALVASPGRRSLLRGAWLGHAVHPPMTDVPIGLWTSATVLDLVGGPAARPAARRLVALGVVTALPTVVTGLAEWAGTEQRDRRVGVVHAAANAVALGLYTGSYAARRRGRQRAGAALAVAGTTAAAAGGYLGGHLVVARKVGSRDPAFDDR